MVNLDLKNYPNVSQTDKGTWRPKDRLRDMENEVWRFNRCVIRVPKEEDTLSEGINSENFSELIKRP